MSDADCAPAAPLATPEGVITPNLKCGPMSTCLEADERCNGVDENADGVVDEGCALTSNATSLGIADEVRALAVLADGRFAISTTQTIHFFDADAREAMLFEGEGVSSLLETRDGFAAMHTYTDGAGADSIDVLLFDGAGLLQRTWPIGSSFRSGLIASADDVLRVVTWQGLVVAFDLATGARVGEVQLANMLPSAELRSAFASGEDAVVLTTNEADCVAWVDADLRVAFGMSGCARTMSDEAGTLYGFEGMRLFTYAPSTPRTEVRALATDSSSPALAISEGDAVLLVYSRASSLAPPHLQLLRTSAMDSVSSSALLSAGERVVAGAPDASRAFILLWSPTSGARLLQVHAR